MKTILEVLKLSTDYLATQKIESPRREAELLLSDFLNKKRLDLYLEADLPLQDNELELFRERLKRRGKGEPGQYIHGKGEFYGLDLLLEKSALIPRPETELLVDKIAHHLSSIDPKGKKLLDLCTGSGCMGLALKKKFPELEVYLSDLSEEALSLAKKNAARNQLEVHFFQGDLFLPLKGRSFDYVVCNPPYISEEEYTLLSPEVRDFEPKMALLAGVSGLEIYERFKEGVLTHLNPKARVWLEIGFLQGPAVLSLFSDKIWGQTALEKDFAGHDRFISLEME